MGKLVIVFIAVLMSMAFADNNQAKKKEVAQLVDTVNKAQNSWTAEYNEFASLEHGKKKSLLGAFKPNPNARKTQVPLAKSIPDEFDARTQWPNCPSIDSVKDQGYCGSCWAVSTASAASDRLCIVTNSNTQVNISAENIMACCSACAANGGCNNGYQIKAWEYLTETGAVTGGDYNSYDGCQPYEIKPTGFHYASEDNIDTPACQTECTNTYYYNNYTDDFHYGAYSYTLPNNVSQIQSDILYYGPNVASIELFDDFYTYKTGVYHYVSGKSNGHHAVRMIGWGTDDNGEDYWLIANSWSRQFGLNGLFKIRRGTNECGVEDYVTAGLMYK